MTLFKRRNEKNDLLAEYQTTIRFLDDSEPSLLAFKVTPVIFCFVLLACMLLLTADFIFKMKSHELNAYSKKLKYGNE